MLFNTGQAQQWIEKGNPDSAPLKKTFAGGILIAESSGKPNEAVTAESVK